MVKIVVSLHYVLQKLLGTESVIIKLNGKQKLREVLLRLCDDVPEAYELLFKGGRLRQELIFMVNGIGVNHLTGDDTEIKDTDVITIVPAIAGG
ncbi:MoaD/ThiS family protein [Candidatus Pyrohabitans sp.]